MFRSENAELSHTHQSVCVLNHDELFSRYLAQIYTFASIIWACFHIFICQSSFKVCNVWHTIEAENCYLFIPCFCWIHMYWAFFYKTNSHLCEFPISHPLIICPYLSYLFLWKENKLFSRVGYCLIDNSWAAHRKPQMYIFYMWTLVQTLIHLEARKKALKRKVWPHNLRRERKQSGDRRGDWPHFFFCFSIAALKTSHKLNSSAHCCLRSLSIARLAFCWSHIDKIKVLASCTSYKLSSKFMRLWLNSVPCNHRTEVLFPCWLLAGGHSASLVAQRLKHLPGMRETRVRSLGQEDPLEKEMATHSSTLAWRISWREEPGRL